MARVRQPSPDQEKGYEEWLASRPPAVQAVAKRFDPWSLYRLKSTKHRCMVCGYEQRPGKVTMRVAVTGEFNLVMFDREVFGIDPDDLEPCDPPGPKEDCGTVMSHQAVVENIDNLRVAMRPDLWTLVDGKAVRKQ